MNVFQETNQTNKKVIKDLVEDIDIINREANEKISNIMNNIKIEIKKMKLSYVEAYNLIKEVAFSESEFCDIMEEIRNNII